jgi:hypothetical protein
MTRRSARGRSLSRSSPPTEDQCELFDLDDDVASEETGSYEAEINAIQRIS